MNKLIIVLICMVLNVFGQDIVDFIENESSLSTLNDLLAQANLKDTLRAGEFTILAPDNNAFATIPTDVLDTVLNDPNFPALLSDLLLYHVTDGTLQMFDFANGPLNMENGQDVIVDNTGLTPVFQDTEGGTADIVTGDNGPFTNGEVHIINSVLIPQFPMPTTTQSPQTTIGSDTTIAPNPNMTTEFVPTTTSLSLPEQNAQDIEELERRVDALERQLDECGCRQGKGKGKGKGNGKGNGKGKGGKGKGISRRGGRFFDRRSRFSRKGRYSNEGGW